MTRRVPLAILILAVIAASALGHGCGGGTKAIAADPNRFARVQERADAAAQEIDEEFSEPDAARESPPAEPAQTPSTTERVRERGDEAQADLRQELRPPQETPLIEFREPPIRPAPPVGLRPGVVEFTEEMLASEGAPPYLSTFHPVYLVEEAVGRAYLVGLDIDQAAQVALKAARRDAIQQALGTPVSDTQLNIVMETPEALRRAFVHVSEVDFQGLVILAREPEWDYPRLERGEGRPAIPGLEARIAAFVAPPLGEVDPGFRVSPSLNNVTFRDGEEVVLTVRSTRNAFLTLFNLYGEAKVAVVVPFPPHVEQVELPASGDVEVFSPEVRDMGIRLRARVLEGMQTSSESFLVVATKDLIPPPRPASGSGLSLDEVMRWIAEIPRNRRAYDVVLFDIRRN